MHLKSLQIKNFRALEDLKISKLGQVNLIVGKNNSGKSSVLEALRIYANAANPNLLEEIALSHDERHKITEAEWSSNPDELPFESFFSGRKFPLTNESILIGENLSEENRKNLFIHHILLKSIEETIEDSNGEKITRTRRQPVEKSGHPDYDSQSILVTKNDQSKMIVLDPSMPGRVNRLWFENDSVLPCSNIPTQFISMDELAKIWDDVQFLPHGDFVKDSLKIISEDFENLAFVNNEPEFSASRTGFRKYQGQPQRVAKVKLRNLDKAVSLNSMGDGMLRVLQLLLKIYPAKNGFLLVDEFENGLHYSIQEKIWGYIFDLAKTLNIQVFATTHNWDCIESFAKIAKERSDIEGVLFRIGRSVRNSDNGRAVATVFDEDQLFNITQSDVEVR